MITLNEIEFRYKKGKPLFEGLNLTLEPGHVYGLLGKNGAGKSTLLKLITGLLFTTKGQASVLGYDPKERIPNMLQEIFVIPEEFELPPVAVNTFITRSKVFYPKFNEQQLNNYLEEFDIPTENKLSEMSFGQKKKFLISFALACNTSIVILDEPTNGLDIPSKSQFRKLVASALDESKLMIISTHQVRDLENLIDGIVILDRGQIIFNNTVFEISEKLAFKEDLTEVEKGNILYAEGLQRKQSGIVKNINNVETRVDLELLFNAVLKEKELINKEFQKP